MERKFYSENFENFLKGHADQFKMSPSKKVWQGIYNDLHPGYRWPSIAISMVFIFTLVIIGHLNTNNGHTTSLYNVASLHNPGIINLIINGASVKQSSTITSGIKNNFNKNITEDNAPSATFQVSSTNNLQPKTKVIIETKDINTDADLLAKNSISNKIENVDEVLYTQNAAVDPLPDVNNLQENKQPIITASNNQAITSTATQHLEIQPQANADNIRKPRKINSVTWTYYLTPSLSYRHFSDNKINKAVIQKPMIGYEAESQLSFNIVKKLQFTTGLQLNYTGYNIQANNSHPIIATLILNGEFPGQYNAYSTMSHYGNGTGTELAKLKNYSLQASLPIGLQYVFAENENIKFSAAANFQPSYVIGSKAYLLSTDKRNYLTDADLIRKWNMNTSLATYISFSSNTLNWQIGPQVRYQILSTYLKNYPAKEHLVNYGIRLGISKISK